MNNLIGVLCVLAFMANSCDKDCNDCGPTGYTRYYMINSTGDPVTLTWIKPSGIIEEFRVSTENRIVLFESSRFGTLGEISIPPFGSITPYDSVRIASASDTIAYTNDDCGLTGNPLCVENYELIKSIDTKDKKIKEWEFKIE